MAQLNGTLALEKKKAELKSRVLNHTEHLSSPSLMLHFRKQLNIDFLPGPSVVILLQDLDAACFSSGFRDVTKFCLCLIKRTWKDAVTNEPQSKNRTVIAYSS